MTKNNSYCTTDNMVVTTKTCGLQRKQTNHNTTGLPVTSLSQTYYPDWSLGFPQFLPTHINTIQ